ncbi:hypothetical protein EJ04DRAFT_527637 [Polyplosphaeria fusca]|uniref:Uncharacterized protein n=1 Tax=Polyplosphaeria fusca TaxID=682080 RepID=A0A9P4QRL6_9PLEO|nr:hypothetical protein EJ04DRAFT_527637 [Polyplosphaeria fusca]
MCASAIDESSASSHCAIERVRISGSPCLATLPSIPRLAATHQLRKNAHSKRSLCFAKAACYPLDPVDSVAGHVPCSTNSVSHCCNAWTDSISPCRLLGSFHPDLCTETAIQLATTDTNRTIEGKLNTKDIIPCEKNSGGDFLFCCGAGCCDKTSSERFTLGNLSYIDHAAVKGSLPSPSSSSVVIAVSESVSASASASASGSSTPFASSPLATPAPRSNPGREKDIKITYGVGIGVGLGVPLLISLLLLFSEHRKNLRLRQEMSGKMGENTQYGSIWGFSTQGSTENGVRYAREQAVMPPRELSDEGKRHELPGTETRK